MPKQAFSDAIALLKAGHCKVKVLSEEIEHHVGEEDEAGDGMFAQARDSGVGLVAPGEEMMARKQELLPKAESSQLPRAQFAAAALAASSNALPRRAPVDRARRVPPALVSPPRFA